MKNLIFAKSFPITWLIIAIVINALMISGASSEIEVSKSDESRCKVVPLKARSVIKADAIFSGTVLSFYIKQPQKFLSRGKKHQTMILLNL
jgi:hypothetical protein